MAADDLMKIRITADFKEAEGAFLKMAKVATAFESDFKRIAGGLNKEFNRINGMAELFGDTTNVVKDKMNALKRAMDQLMATGLQAMNPEVQKLKAQYDGLAASLDKTTQATNKNNAATQSSANTVKKSSQQWTNIALVVQDLPYGFRGIQNNLPALVGGFAAATGAIYLGFSVLIAITTAYEKEIAQLIYGIDGLSIATKKMNEALAANIGQAKSQIASDQALLKIINDTTKSTSERERALAQLKKEYQGNIELQKLDIQDGDKLALVYDKISNALIRRAKATAYASLIAEEETKIFKLQNQQGEEVVKNLGFMGTVYGLATGGMLGFNSASNIVLDAFSKQAKEIKQSQSNIELYTKKLNENTDASNKNADAQSLDSSAIKKKGDNAKKEADKLAAYVAKRLAASGGETKYVAEPALDPSNAAKAFKDKMAYEKKASKDRVAFLREQYQLEVSEAEGSFDKIKLAEENMRMALDKGFMDGSVKLSEYIDAILELRKKSNETVLAETKAVTAELLKIGIGLMNALGPALDMLLEKGSSIGEVLSRAFEDIIKKLIKVAIAAAIAVAIISLLPGGQGKLAKAGGAMKMFGNLVGGGMGLGSQLFANGGIVSGPTMGLMGEYPGAQNNPEVVAPLDKLKDMIGGGSGSGEFVLRGNDLILAIQRSNSSLKLRRG
jgi:hypothetical protein